VVNAPQRPAIDGVDLLDEQAIAARRHRPDDPAAAVVSS
jgi:hypothetical protein